MKKLLFPNIGKNLLACANALCLLFLFLSTSGPTHAASAFQEAEASMNAAEKNFEEGMQAFDNPSAQTSGQGASQKSGKMSYSSATRAQNRTSNAVTPEEARAQALQGSPETGYAGTWTDPDNGDIITSVIAPKPPAQQNANSYPLYIAPNVGDWGSEYNSSSNWSGSYPGWPVTPDNPGYGPGWPGATPPPPPPPPPGPGFGDNFYPYPKPPSHFHPGYRPLHPGQAYPPFGNSGNPFQPQPPWMSQNPALKPNLPPNSGSFPPGQLPPPPPGPGMPPNQGFYPPQSGYPGSYPGAPRPPAWPGCNPPGGSLWHPGMDGPQPSYPGMGSGPFPRPNSFMRPPHTGQGRSLMDARH